MLTKVMYNELSKSQIITFLGLANGKYAKEHLVTLLLNQVTVQNSELLRLLTTFPRELAVGPNELEELLHCSRAERKRWTKEDKLPVLEYRTFYMVGAERRYPVYDRLAVLGITPHKLASWRAEQDALALAHRKASRVRAAEQRRIHKQMRQEFFAGWEAQIEVWDSRGSREISAIFQLAYWTTTASHWAKENHLKALHATTRAATYVMLRDAWYRRKNEAMHVLAQTPYAKLAFYRPENPDKMTLQLCEEHYDLMREGYYESKWNFYAAHATEVTRCPGCFVCIEKDYYSLYFLEIVASTCPDTYFSFHIPYIPGKSMFPPPQELPRVEHIEQEGIFRFGRTISQYEKIIHPEQDVQAHLTQVLAHVRRLYRIDYMRVPAVPQP